MQFGGTDEETNLMALCRECHARKSIAENACRKQIHGAIQTILRGGKHKHNVLRERIESCEKELTELRAQIERIID